MDLWVIGLIGFLVVIVLVLIYYFNKFMGLNNQAEADWKMIDTLLQQRLDTIPNLIAMAKRIMKQEKELFTGLANAREGAAKAQGVEGKIKANKQLGGMLLNFFARAEAYPEMKSNQNMQTVMENLASIEDKIKYGRQRYNYTVKDFVNAVTFFPGNVFAGLFGYARSKWPYFEAEEKSRKAVDAAKLLEEE
ncbi:MAG: LemA family protein [Candidatus Micrarchaeota archaeon]